MAEPAFYLCANCHHSWVRTEWKTRLNPPAACPRCSSTAQTIDQASEDNYVRQVYGPITGHVSQLLNKKLEGKNAQSPRKKEGPMKVYIVVKEPFHDNSTILSVHTTIEGAEHSIPDAPGEHGTERDGSPRGRWSRAGGYVGNGPRQCFHTQRLYPVSQRFRPETEPDPDFPATDVHLIYELDLQDDKSAS